MLSRLHKCALISHIAKKLEPVSLTWKLNADGIDDLKQIQNKDCVLGALRLKTKNILSPGVKSVPTNAKFYIQWLDPSTQHFRILVTTTNLYFLCPAKTDIYKHDWESSYTSHSIFVISKGISCVFRENDIIFGILPMVFDKCTGYSFPHIYGIAQWSYCKFSVICIKGSYVLIFTAFQDTRICISVFLLYNDE